MHEGYFTRHNIKFRPERTAKGYSSKLDSVPSDIDVIGIHPRYQGQKRVMVATCKAWQEGFDVANELKQLRDPKGIIAGRPAWKSFRELVNAKWSYAFRKKVQEVTGSRKFTYLLVVTHAINIERRHLWEDDREFQRAIGGNPIKILTLSEMLDRLSKALTMTPAASEIGRSLQLMKAAKWRPEWSQKKSELRP